MLINAKQFCGLKCTVQSDGLVSREELCIKCEWRGKVEYVEDTIIIILYTCRILQLWGSGAQAIQEILDNDYQKVECRAIFKV